MVCQEVYLYIAQDISALQVDERLEKYLYKTRVRLNLDSLNEFYGLI